MSALAAMGITVIVLTLCCLSVPLPLSSAAPSAAPSAASSAAADDAAANMFMEECQKQKVDVVFLQDASFSVTNSSFEASKLFIVHIVQHLPVHPQRVRVALVRFDTYADVIASLTQSSDVRTVTAAIEGMTHMMKGTQTGRALKAARLHVLNERRPDARAVVVVITDGNSMNFRETRQEAKKLREDHVRLIWLYISANDTDVQALRREQRYMAGEGDITLAAASFQALGEETRMQIVNASCREDPEPETTAMDATTTTSFIPPLSTTSSPFSSADLHIKTSSASPLTTQDDDDVTEHVTSPSDEEETSRTDEAMSKEAVTTSPSERSKSSSAQTPLTTAETGKSAAPDEHPLFSTHTPSTTAEAAKTTAPDDLSQTKSSARHTPPSSSGTRYTEPAAPDTSPSTLGTKQKPASTGSTSPVHVIVQEQSLLTTNSRGETSSAQNPNSANPDRSRNQASRGDGEEDEEEEEAFEDRVENIVGVTVGVFAAVALTSGCVYYAVVRRRKDRRKKENDP